MKYKSASLRICFLMEDQKASDMRQRFYISHRRMPEQDRRRYALKISSEKLLQFHSAAIRPVEDRCKADNEVDGAFSSSKVIEKSI